MNIINGKETIHICYKSNHQLQLSLIAHSAYV